MGRSERYDFEIQGKPGGNVGLIMNHIDMGRKVLELGCATGYMTKYMNDKLCCSVDVVEIDYECCKKAMKFAHDWYCGDLMEDGWVSYYKQYKYDYVLFADVLEHLRDPLEVLKKAVSLLKDDGEVIISIPNICHNDILIRMYFNDFCYTGLGLLDETHIHFWGVNQLAKFVDEAGLKITAYEAVTMQTQRTEQKYQASIPEELLNVLKKREFGEVYQWVITCEKTV